MSIVVLTLILVLSISYASEEAPVSIVISQSIQNRQPVGPTLESADQFKIINNKLYAWTHLKKVIPGRVVHHVWYHQDTIMDDIRLPIGAQLGRMYSAKTIRKPYIGVWRVEILQEDRTLLDVKYFEVDLIQGELFAVVIDRPREQSVFTTIYNLGGLDRDYRRNFSPQ